MRAAALANFKLELANLGSAANLIPKPQQTNTGKVRLGYGEFRLPGEFGFESDEAWQTLIRIRQIWTQRRYWTFEFVEFEISGETRAVWQKKLTADLLSTMNSMPI